MTAPIHWQSPTLVYWHNGHEITTRLRGLDMYRGMALVALGARADGYDGDVVRDSLEFHVYGGVGCAQPDGCARSGDPGHQHPFHVYASHRYVKQAEEEALHHPCTPMHTIVRVVNPANAPVIKMLHWLRGQGAVIIVDVTMPVRSPEQLIGFEPPESPLHELDNEANREFWRPGGEAHTALIAAMRMAHVVTVPNEMTALDAITANRSVMVVPDLVADGDEQNTSAVMEALGAAQNRGLRLARDPDGGAPFVDLLRRWL
jgi:hypothetical protein